MAYGARFGSRGWLAVLAIFLGFTLTAFFTFEVARRFHAYEYKSFMRQLIGAFWPAFDLLYVVMALVIIAVMASAASHILRETLGVPPAMGTAAVVIVVGVLTYHGASVIEAFKSAGTALLYLAYLTFSGLVLAARGGALTDLLAASGGGAAVEGQAVAAAVSPDVSVVVILGTGVLYVGYNLAVYPTALYTLHRQRRRRDAAVGALVAGLLMTLPFALTWLCLMAFYPDPAVYDAPVPWLPMLRSLGHPPLIAVFGLVMGWTLVETSVGLIHALLDRVDADVARLRTGRFARAEGLTRLQSGLLGAGILLGAAFLSRVGIIALVSRAYAFLGYALIALFALPLLTVGAWKVLRSPSRERSRNGSPGS